MLKTVRVRLKIIGARLVTLFIIEDYFLIIFLKNNCSIYSAMSASLEEEHCLWLNTKKMQGIYVYSH